MSIRKRKPLGAGALLPGDGFDFERHGFYTNPGIVGMALSIGGVRRNDGNVLRQFENCLPSLELFAMLQLMEDGEAEL